MEPDIYVKTMHGIVSEVATRVVTAEGRKWNMAFVVGLDGGTKFQVNFPVELQVQPNQRVRAVEVLKKGRLLFYPVFQNLNTGKIAHVYMPYPRRFAPVNLLLSTLSSVFLGSIAASTMWALDHFELCVNDWWLYAGAVVTMMGLAWDAYVAKKNDNDGKQYLDAIEAGIAKHYDARTWSRVLVRNTWRKVLISAIVTTQPNNIALEKFDPTHINTQPRGIRL